MPLKKVRKTPVRSEAPGQKLTNPKQIIGSDKIPFHLWPTTASMMGVLGMLDGALKYGRSNFRAAGVKATVYIDALLRHTFAFLEGEDVAPDSLVPHLGHMLACIAIMIDAKAAGRFTDDRLVEGGYFKLLAELTPHVARLKAAHADKNPKHYTIADKLGSWTEDPKLLKQVVRRMVSVAKKAEKEHARRNQDIRTRAVPQQRRKRRSAH